MGAKKGKAQPVKAWALADMSGRIFTSRVFTKPRRIVKVTISEGHVVERKA